MRLQKYLKEEFFDGIKKSGHYFEVYVNPTKKEFEDLKVETHDEIRFILDFDKKKIYMWEAGIIHHEALEHSSALRKALNITNSDDMYNGKLKDYSRMFTGTLEHGRVLSDSFPGDFRPKYKPWAKKILSDLENMLKADKSFASKYLNTREVDAAIQETIDAIRGYEP